MYISGFVVPVPRARKEDYRRLAEQAAVLFREYGALEVMEAWGDHVPEGHTTDFRRAVQAEPDEEVVFSWIAWPDRETCERGQRTMETDERMACTPEDAPMGMKRMIFGGFVPIVTSKD